MRTNFPHVSQSIWRTCNFSFPSSPRTLLSSQRVGGGGSFPHSIPHATVTVGVLILISHHPKKTGSTTDPRRRRKKFGECTSPSHQAIRDVGIAQHVRRAASGALCWKRGGRDERLITALTLFRLDPTRHFDSWR